MAYQVGETIRLTAIITDVDDVAADPTTVIVLANKPDGTVAVSAVEMVKLEVGSYYYDYLISSNTGVYKWKATATGSGGRITIVKRSFAVEKSI